MEGLAVTDLSEIEALRLQDLRILDQIVRGQGSRIGQPKLVCSWIGFETRSFKITYYYGPRPGYPSTKGLESDSRTSRLGFMFNEGP